MTAVGAGARAPFEQLFERYRQPVWGFFRRRVGDPSVAEDLAQTVFTALLEAAPRYEAQSAFRSYLFTIAFNVLQAERRRHASRATSALDEEISDAHAPDADRALWVRAALAQLDPDDRELVMLREYRRTQLPGNRRGQAATAEHRALASLSGADGAADVAGGG